MSLDMFKALKVGSKSLSPIFKRAPFSLPGCKFSSLEHIIEILPKKDVYIEPFGGTGIVMINRAPVRLEVFNDINSGIYAFYTCLRDDNLREELLFKIEMSVHSYEEFCRCRDNWSSHPSLSEIAYMWYYHIMYSFGCIGRHFGRSVRVSSTKIGNIRSKITSFDYFHNRLKHVILENCSYEEILDRYDDYGAVFYLDPPYYETKTGAYRDEMLPKQHEELLKKVFKLKGSAYVSSYGNELYRNQPWDNVYSWSIGTKALRNIETVENNLCSREFIPTKDTKEYLYVKL